MSQLNIIGSDNTVFYSDFDFDFSPHPKTGDITILKNNLSIQNSIKNLLQTKFGEILFNPDIGSGIKFSLFDPIDNITHYKIKQQISSTLTAFEPRVSLENVELVDDPKNNGIYVYIYFSVINSYTISKVQVFLQRVR